MTAYDNSFEPEEKPGIFETYTEIAAAFTLAAIVLLFSACVIAWALHGFSFPGAQ